jgi:hypothetical protein
MKNKILIAGFMLAAICLTGCGKKVGNDILEQTQKEVASSRVVGYAVANSSKPPNMVFTVTEIWKGSEDASTLGVTNGTRIECEYRSTQNIPEAIIVLFPPGGSPSGLRSVIWVRQGQVSDMPVREFKTKIGL